MARYIDKDKLMETLGITDMDCDKCAWSDGAGFCTRSSDFTDACAAIEDAPVTFINENNIGHWERHPNKEFREWDVCTACGLGCKRREYGITADGNEWVEEESYGFCPRCGAKMVL